MTEEELLRSLGLSKFGSVEALADAYKAVEKKVGGKTQSLSDQLSELTAAERAELGLGGKTLGGSKLEGELGAQSNKIIAEHGISADQADSIVQGISTATSVEDTSWKADLQTFLDSDSSGALVTDDQGNATSNDRNGEFVNRYLKKYNKDPVEFREQLENGDISLAKMKLIADEGRRVAEVERASGVEVAFEMPDVVNPAEAQNELNSFYENPELVNSLHDTADPDHQSTKARYESLKNLVISTNQEG